MNNATLAALADPLRGFCPPPFYDVKSFGLDGCKSLFPCCPLADLTDINSRQWTFLCASRSPQEGIGLLLAMSTHRLPVSPGYAATTLFCLTILTALQNSTHGTGQQKL